VADHHHGVSAADRQPSGVLWWQGNQIATNLAEIRQQRDTLSKLHMQTWGVTYLETATDGFWCCRRG
jgi:hypothetical protein